MPIRINRSPGLICTTGNNSNTRIRGTRIKHRMGEVSIKMYDKFGEVKHKDGTVTEEKAPMKKSIYCLFVLFNILKAANRRYLEFISTFDDPSDGLKNLGKVSKTVESSERTYKGFNFFNEDDQKLLEVLARGEFNFKGIQNKTILEFIPEKSSAAISRIIKRLYVHVLVKKVKGTYRYYLTNLDYIHFIAAKELLSK